MSKENLKLWDAMKSPPDKALKKIHGGRLKGMSDISPQWRYAIMTETFGPVGIGWKFTIDKQWLEDGAGGLKSAHTNVSLFVKHDGEWSDAIPGTGGSMYVAKESGGLYTSDEALKMSLTDALSVAMKVLGVAADVYSGGLDYTKYSQPDPEDAQMAPSTLTDEEIANIETLIDETQADMAGFKDHFKIKRIGDMQRSHYTTACRMLEGKRLKK